MAGEVALKALIGLFCACLPYLTFALLGAGDPSLGVGLRVKLLPRDLDLLSSV